MIEVRVTISKFIDESNPGWVECLLVDVEGRTWKYREKVPVVSAGDLWVDSEYPRPGTIACAVIGQRVDASGRQILKIKMSAWTVEGYDGGTEVEVFGDQLEGDAADL